MKPREIIHHLLMGEGSILCPWTIRPKPPQADLQTMERFILEGLSLQSNEWRRIGEWSTEQEARRYEADFRRWQPNLDFGWGDFRVIHETATRQVMPNKKDQL